MNKESIIDELIRMGVFKTEDGKQLYELSFAELLEMLEDEGWKKNDST